jgi:hypothetical protein
MDRRFVILVCSAAMLGLAAMPAAAQQKTAKQCNDEWTASKATIQASGKTKKVFIAECRGQATAAPTAAPKPATTAAPKPPRTAASSPAANVKTAKQCNDDWTANKAAIQAGKKTKKEFMAECRAQPAGASTTTAAPPPAATPVKPPSTAATPPAPGTPPAAEPARPSTAAPTTPPPITAPARQPSTAAAPPTTPPPATTRAPAAPAPTAAGQFSTEAQAKARCPGDTVVWVNLNSKVYHFAGTRNYGTTKSGAYMCERDATTAGSRAAKNEKRP